MAASPDLRIQVSERLRNRYKWLVSGVLWPESQLVRAVKVRALRED